MRRKKKNMIIIIVVSIIVVLGILAAIFVPSMIKKQEESGKEEDTVETDYDLDKAKSLLAKFGFDERFGCQTIAQNSYDENFKMLWALKKVDASMLKEANCSDLFSEDKLEGVDTSEPKYKGEVGVCFSNSKTNTISYKDANAVYKKLYGEEMPKKSISGLKINSMFYEFYDYNSNKDLFISMSCNGCGGACMSNNLREIKSATLKGNTLVIDFYDFESGYIDAESSHNYNLKTSKVDTMIECSSNSECINKIKSEHLNDLDLYEAVFEKKNDEFIFKSFIKKLS